MNLTEIHGLSLPEFLLQKYLRSLGECVKIIPFPFNTSEVNVTWNAFIGPMTPSATRISVSRSLASIEDLSEAEEI
jgi:hypothetical protein